MSNHDRINKAQGCLSQIKNRKENRSDCMISFAVCDDEKEFRKKIIKTIDKMFMKSSVDYNINQFARYDKNFQDFIGQPITSKIYILDIELNDSVSGIDIARKIRKQDWNSIIIMVTSHSDLGYDALKAQIMLLAFISKYDECEKNLADALKKAITMVSNKKILTFEANGIFHRIYLDDILYVTKDTIDRTCIIQTTYSQFSANMTMNKMMEELDERFFLAHRSCLVNTEKIKMVDWKQNVIYFEHEEHIDLLSRDKKKGLKELVNLG